MGIRDIQMKYTIDNPKLVEYYKDCEEDDFTGVVKDIHGHIVYYENDKYHRTDGPAIIFPRESKQWYIHGKRHRADGPAVENDDGTKVWHYNNERYGYNDDFTIESWIKKWKLEIFK